MKSALRSQPVKTPAYRQNGGFTLIETLAALGIAGMLLAAIGVSLDLFWKHRKLSHTRMTASQTLRGIIEDMTQDLRGTLCVVAVRTPIVNAEASGSAENGPNAARGASRSDRPPSSDTQPGQEQLLRIREQFMDLDGTEQSVPAHFVGTSTIMAVYQTMLNSRFENSVNQYVQPQGYHAVWYVGSTTAGRIAVGRRGNQPETAYLAALKAEQMPQLMRTSRVFGSGSESGSQSNGRSVVNQRQGSLQKQSTSMTAISDQVKEIRFRYLAAEQSGTNQTGSSENRFNPSRDKRPTENGQWFDTWNSDERQALPVAVECRLTLVSNPQQPFTFIIRLPQSPTDVPE